MLDFHKYWSADETVVYTEYSSIRATFMANWAENCILAIAESAEGRGRSQVQEFVDFYAGPGVQHIAILTEDIVGLVRGLRSRGCKFLQVPDEYYTFLEKRLENCPYDIHTDLETLKELRILVDYDEEGFLLQIFTECV
jgi:4-hydroxyphenylpyruvate dioxygenase